MASELLASVLKLDRVAGISMFQLKSEESKMFLLVMGWAQLCDLAASGVIETIH